MDAITLSRVGGILGPFALIFGLVMNIIYNFLVDPVYFYRVWYAVLLWGDCNMMYLQIALIVGCMTLWAAFTFLIILWLDN